MNDMETAHGNRIAITIIGQEGDPKPLEVNIHEHIAQLLRQGLRELYGAHHPNPDDFDVVVAGKIIEPLTKTVEDAGIGTGTRVSILPKSVSRG